MSILQKLLKQFLKLQHFVDRCWYLPVLGLLAGLDLFVLVVPTDALLVSTVIVRPRRWPLVSLVLALGSAIGAWLMARFFSGGAVPSRWIDVYGPWAIGLNALGPLPQQPLVAAAALAGISGAAIFISTFFGRLLKYLILGYLASHAPRLLSRIPGLRFEMEQMLLKDKEK
jgi:membrane protein YqaA with SNARE-associated domain